MQFDFTPRGLMAIRHLRYKRFWLMFGLMLVVGVVYGSTTSRSVIPIAVFNMQDKVLHMVVYAGLMGWFAQLFRHDLTRLICVIFFISLGIVMEFIQGMVPARQFDIVDMVANTSGVLLAWALAYTWVGDILVRFEGLVFRRS